MAIRIEQPGAAKAAAQAGTAIGKGKRATEDRARAEREQARTQQIAAQQKARQASLEWEQEKMRMRSEQDFQQELATKQWDYEKFNRAKSWQIEKMEIASRNDFAQEEKDRSEKQAKTAAGLKAIDESDNIYATPEAKEEAKFKFMFKQEQGYFPPRQLQEKGPPSATRQKGEIEAQFELEGYTQEDLRELGLDPADFPGVGREVGEEGLPSPTTQEEYNVIPRGSQYLDSDGNIRTKS